MIMKKIKEWKGCVNSGLGDGGNPISTEDARIALSVG
jgi:hypothetical protein